MKLPDELMPTYARFAAFRPRAEADRLAADLAAGRANPMEEKKRLAQEIVARYNGETEARAAREYFERTVQRRELPTDAINEIDAGDCKRVTELLVKAG